MKIEEIWICVRFRDNDFSNVMRITGCMFSDNCNELYKGLLCSSFAGAREYYIKRLSLLLDPKNIVEVLKRYYVSVTIRPDILCTDDFTLSDGLSKVKSDLAYLNFEEAVKVFRVKNDFDSYMKQYAGTFDQDFLLLSFNNDKMTAAVM